MSLFSSNDEHFCTPFALHNQTNIRTREQIEISHLEPENEYGNVEYKLRLTDPTPERVERLVTQLKWRIREGQGEAILFLGVKDNGQFVGLTPEEIRLSLQTLERMSSKIGATMTIVKEKIVEPGSNDESETHLISRGKNKVIRIKGTCERKSKENSTKSISSNNDPKCTAETRTTRKASSSRASKRVQVRKVIQVLVKRKTHDILDELRLAVLGPTESGKSSLLGVLSHGEYDNGRGSARLNLFRHRHEVRSGHTSSISQEVFGFDCHGEPLTYNNCLTTEEIIESSSRVVTLIDLAGHQRYLSTTLFGLGSHSPDLVLIVISAISTISSITLDYISLALGIEKSSAIVINKIDLASKELQNICYDELVGALRISHPDIDPQMVITIDDALRAGSRLSDPNYLPIFFTSCVTGPGFNALYSFLNAISPRLNQDELTDAVSRSSELQVDETFEVPGIGTVVSGLMMEGIIREGDEMLLGPDDAGNFANVSIVSLQRHKFPCNFARAGQKCTMAIVADNIKVRRGMVLKEMDHEWRQNFSVCLRFGATIRPIDGKPLKLRRGSPVSVYVGNVKQTCSVTSYGVDPVDNSFVMQLKLTKRPEYIRKGSRIILRHAMTKAVGTVTSVEKFPQRLLNLSKTETDCAEIMKISC